MMFIIINTKETGLIMAQENGSFFEFK